LLLVIITLNTMKKINLDIAPQFGYNSVMEEIK
jgi:hypothetical protein